MASMSFVRFLGLVLFLAASSNLLASAQLTCPNHFILLKDRCYLFVEKYYATTFDEARINCSSYSVGTSNYDMLSINNYEEYALITAELQVKGWRYTVVGAYQETTYEWYWVDGTPLSLDDSMWDCGLQLSKSSSYLIAYLTFVEDQDPNCYNFGSFRLRVQESSSMHGYICEGPALSASSNLLTTAVQFSCPADYILLNGRCYFFSHNINANFEDARSYCNSSTFGSYNYDLLIISDNEEFALVTAELPINGYLGLVGGYREGNTSNWKWVDGSPLAFDHNLFDCDVDSQDPNIYNVAFITYINLQVPNCYNFNSFRLKVTASSYDQLPFICEGPAYSDALLRNDNLKNL